MNKICLFAILIAVVSANLAVDVGRPFLSQDSLNCLAKLNFTKAIAIIAEVHGHVYEDFTNAYNFAKVAGFTLFDARLIVNDTLIPEQFSGVITKALPPSFNGTVWLFVFYEQYQWQLPVNRRIAYLEELVLAFKQRGVKVGIFSRFDWWAEVVGSREAGSDILKSVPVLYNEVVPLPTFADWDKARFGTWDEPAMKNYDFSIDICSTRVNFFNYYETYN